MTRNLSPFAVLLLPALLAGQAAQQPGPRDRLQERTLEVDGAAREYLLHLPPSYRPESSGEKSFPLVLMLHGRGSSAKQAASSYYGWTELADKEGIVVAFPNAEGRPKSWRPAWGRNSADAPFLAALIDALVDELRIDRKRVFMTGHSSGGIMSFSFAATHSDKVAAIGPVAGTIGWGRATVPVPKSPVPVIAIHGMADRIVPYDKERGKNAAYAQLVGAPTSAAFFAKHNKCEDEPRRRDLFDGKVHLDTWKAKKGGAPVAFYSIVGGSHGWPRGRRGGLNATELIWTFFKQQAEPRTKTPRESGGKKQKAGGVIR